MFVGQADDARTLSFKYSPTMRMMSSFLQLLNYYFFFEFQCCGNSAFISCYIVYNLVGTLHVLKHFTYMEHMGLHIFSASFFMELRIICIGVSGGRLSRYWPGWYLWTYSEIGTWCACRPYHKLVIGHVPLWNSFLTKSVWEKEVISFLPEINIFSKDVTFL